MPAWIHRGLEGFRQDLGTNFGPDVLGNGHNVDENLYWGARYGIRTFFRRSAAWTEIKPVAQPGEMILERVAYQHRREAVLMIADAYRGDAIRTAIANFLEVAAGARGDTAVLDGRSIAIGGAAHLVAYVGHNGLMDLALEDYMANTDGRERDAIVLACYSQTFFAEGLRAAKARPILWTRSLMAPEAYSLHAALEGWIEREDSAAILNRAVDAYATYQKTSTRAARSVFRTGW